MTLKVKLPSEFVLVGTDNNGVRHRYSVEKNESFKVPFLKFMEELGFDAEEIGRRFSYEEKIGGDEDGRPIYEPMELKIRDINDVCWYFKNSEYEIDIFYGNMRIILVIRTKQEKERERRNKLLDNLEDKSKWKEFPKITRINEKKKAAVLPGMKPGPKKG